jgi:Uncharacterized protein conserved in bacteria (DUF2252)
VFEEFLGPSEFATHGERVVSGQRVMQASSDIFLGWPRLESAETASRATSTPSSRLEGVGGDRGMIPKGMAMYGRLCGWTTARAHARLGGDRLLPW